MALGGKWFGSAAALEDYLESLADLLDTGVIALERARCTVLYAEAVAEVPELDRVANSDSVKSILKELVLSMSSRPPKAKKQARRHVAIVLMHWENVVVEAGMHG